MPIERMVIVGLFAALGCHRSQSQSQSQAQQQPAPILADPAKQAVLRDLQQDLAAARAAIVGQKNPIYACDRLALAARELSDQRDEGVLKLLADAETVYGLQGPVAWADAKLNEAEAKPELKVDDCAAAHDMLNRVATKFAGRAEVLDLVQRYKALCPRLRSPAARSERGSSSSSSSSVADRSAQQRSDCRHRCDEAAFDCNGRCSTCYGCTTTWEQCNSQCSACKQGCDQNQRFCLASCGN
jgi:hypothetical protein